MTRQELRDEAKESDGRPETKQRIRQMQQTMARRRMMHKVPTADVVIVNPDPLRGGAQVRPEENARAARAREGRRSGRAEHPPHRRGASRAGVRVAETGARAVPLDRLEQGNPRRPVRGGGAGALLHLPGAHLESDPGRAGSRGRIRRLATSTTTHERARHRSHLRRIRPQRPGRAGAGHGGSRHDGAAAAGVPAGRLLHLQHFTVDHDSCWP